MCANVRTPLGPEMSMILSQTAIAQRNLSLRLALDEEFGGQPSEWVLLREEVGAERGPPPDGHALSFWRRLLRRAPRRPPPSPGAVVGGLVLVSSPPAARGSTSPSCPPAPR